MPKKERSNIKELKRVTVVKSTMTWERCVALDCRDHEGRKTIGDISLNKKPPPNIVQ